MNRYSIALVIAVLLDPFVARADPPPGYYTSIDASSPASLAITLNAVIDDHTR